MLAQPEMRYLPRSNRIGWGPASNGKPLSAMRASWLTNG